LATAGSEGSLTAALGPGFDSNPRRTVGEESPGDALLLLAATGQGRLVLGERQTLSGRLELGAKKFASAVDEDVLAQQLDAQYAVRLGDFLLGASGLAKARQSRGGARDYVDLGGDVLADRAFSRALSLRLAAGVRRFFYWPDRGYDALGPRGTLSARWAPSRQHLLTAALSLALSDYAAYARLSQTEVGTARRKDRVLGAQASYSFLGPVAIQASYAYFQVSSNSFGERSARHRLSAAMTGHLPWGLIGSLQAAWQFVRYPDGILLSQALVIQDDESQSLAAAKLALPLSQTADLELRWALHWIVLPPRDAQSPTLRYLRQTANLGLSLRW
jgi:hypothetical protein